MALIKCPECGHDVSTFAQTCPNCGYPIQQQQKPPQVEEIKPERTRQCPVCKKSLEVSIETCPVCGYILGPYTEPVYTAPTTPHCPTCGSTDITKLGVASRAISGAIFGALSVEGRAQFRCNHCGYQW